MDRKLPIEVPKESLSSDALLAIIESFILREGTDYGVTEAAMERKIKDIELQLAKGEIKIVFDFETESVTLLSTIDFKKFQASRIQK